MNRMRFALLVALFTAVSNGQQQKRDLTVKDVEPPKAPRAAIAPPRSYALIVGVGQYQNLTPQQNLQFSERDADSIYSILISPEGGNFRAENVHRTSFQRGPHAIPAEVTI